MKEMKDELVNWHRYSINSVSLVKYLYHVAGTAGNMARYYVKSGHYYISDAHGYTAEPYYMGLEEATRLCFA